MQSLTGEQAAAGQQELAGKAALIASVGGQRGWADWTNPDHRLRRLLSEFIGMAGLTFVLSGAVTLAEAGDLNKFASGRAVVKHAGLNPSERTSATINGQALLTLAGRGQTVGRLIRRGSGRAG